MTRAWVGAEVPVTGECIITARQYIPSVADARDAYLFACWFHAVFRRAALTFDNVEWASVALDVAQAAESDRRREGRGA